MFLRRVFRVFAWGLSCLLCAGFPRFACERGGDAGGAVNSRVVVFLALRMEISACGVLCPSERRFGSRCTPFRNEIFRLAAFLTLWKDAVLWGSRAPLFVFIKEKFVVFLLFSVFFLLLCGISTLFWGNEERCSFSDGTRSVFSLSILLLFSFFPVLFLFFSVLIKEKRPILRRFSVDSCFFSYMRRAATECGAVLDRRMLFSFRRGLPTRFFVFLWFFD